MFVRRTATRFAALVIADLRCRALLAGGGIGCVTSALSRTGGDTAQTMPIALLFLLSGSASFVLHALHLQAAASSARGSQRSGGAARRCITWLGSGIAASMQALALLAG